MNCIKVELHPNKRQVDILNNWFGAFRWFYNRTIDYIEKTKEYNFFKVRNNMRVESKFPVPDWCKEISPRIISGAINDCCKAYKTSLSLLKNKKQTHFKINYKNKKQVNQTLFLEKSCFSKTNHLLPKYLNDRLLGTYHKRNKKGKTIKIELKKLKIEHDCRLTFNGSKYILYIPNKKVRKQQINGGIISLDSGVRTFQTGYSSNHHCIKFGDNIKEHLKKYMKKQDILRSTMDLCRKALKSKYLKKLKRTNLVIRNKVDDLHWKTIKYLINNYQTILMGDLKIKQILKHMDKGSNRTVNILRHYEFKQRLLYSVKKNGNDFYIVDESYTSKTCSRCGCIDKHLGSNKEYNCNECKLLIDRDINGARNILIKNYKVITDSYITL
jgi:putative transposase